MSNVSEFPIFISAGYRENDVFSRFQADVENATRSAERQFDQFSQNANRLVSQAVTMPRTSSGALNLGVAEAQAAARAADERAAAAREVANAVRLAAAAEGDYSQSARLSIAAAEALANDERQAAQAARDHAAAVAQVQAQLDRTSKAMANSNNVVRLNTASAGAQRAAYVQLGQQLQDATIQAQMGTSALTILTQQGSQAAFALSGLGGTVGRVAGFFAGPWGAAIFAATALTGGLTAALWSNRDALDGLTGSAAANKSATEALTTATAALDEITGRLKESTDERRVATGLATAETIRSTQANLAEAESLLAVREAQLSAQRARAGNNFSNSAMAGLFGLTAQVDAERGAVDGMRKALAEARKSLQFAMQPTSFGRYNAVRFAGGVSAPREASRAAGGGGSVTQEARDAERAVKELESKIASLESRLDPATAAAKEYAAALETINQAAAKGTITQGRGQELSTAAMFAERQRQNAAEAADVARFLQVYKPIDVDGLVESSEAYSRRIAEKWKDSQRDAADEFASALQTVDIAKSLVSGRGIAGLGRGLASGQLDLGNPQFTDAFSKAFKAGVEDIESAFSGALKDVLGPDSAKVGEALGKGFLGAQIGGMTSDLLEGIGIQNSKLGSQIGGAIGSAFGPIGSLIGSVIGGVGIEALKPTKRGSATIGGSGAQLIVASSRGNSSQRVKASVETADEAITTLERIAEALGGRIDAARGAVSIGVRGDSFRVDTSGRGITKTKRGAVDFGDDSAAAIRFATLDLIQDGVVQGIRASTQRVLQSGKDLESAIQRAVDFQSVFDRLQARIDPVGAAITGVEREFSRLRDIFGQAQASAEEYADLEKLFQMERTDAIKEANERVLGSMQALLDDLRFGDNGRSLRDRLAAAQAKFDPLAARVEAGDKTAYDDFAEAARVILDIQRQFSGSQTAFFALQDRITTLTARAVEGGNVTSILTGGSSIPSAQADAQRAFEAAPIVDAIGQQTTDLINGIVSGLGRELRDIRVAVSGGGGRIDIPGFFAQEVRQI